MFIYSLTFIFFADLQERSLSKIHEQNFKLVILKICHQNFPSLSKCNKFIDNSEITIKQKLETIHNRISAIAVTQKKKKKINLDFLTYLVTRQENLRLSRLISCSSQARGKKKWRRFT